MMLAPPGVDFGIDGGAFGIGGGGDPTVPVWSGFNAAGRLQLAGNGEGIQGADAGYWCAGVFWFPTDSPAATSVIYGATTGTTGFTVQVLTSRTVQFIHRDGAGTSRNRSIALTAPAGFHSFFAWFTSTAIDLVVDAVDVAELAVTGYSEPTVTPRVGASAADATPLILGEVHAIVGGDGAVPDSTSRDAFFTTFAKQTGIGGYDGGGTATHRWVAHVLDDAIGTSDLAKSGATPVADTTRPPLYAW